MARNIDHVRELIIIAAGIGLVVGFIVGVLVAAAIIYTDKTRSVSGRLTRWCLNG